MTGLFLAWYLLYVLLASYAPVLHGDQARAATSTSAWSSACCSSSRRSRSPSSTCASPTGSWTRWPGSCAARSRAGDRGRNRTGPGSRNVEGASSEPRGGRRGQQPHPQPHDLRPVRRHHAGHRGPGQQAGVERRVRLLHRGRRLHRPAERHRDLRRLPVGRVVPRHRRRDRAQRLRRLPLLGRLPRGVARGAAARRRAAAQHRQVHDGRRAGVPDAPAPGPRRGRHLHAGRVVLLPARPDGGRGRPRRAAAQRHQQGRAGASSSRSWAP